MNALELLKREGIEFELWLEVMFPAATISLAESVTAGYLMHTEEPPIVWLKFMKPNASVGGKTEEKIFQVGSPWVRDGGFEKKV